MTDAEDPSRDDLHEGSANDALISRSLAELQPPDHHAVGGDDEVLEAVGHNPSARKESVLVDAVEEAESGHGELMTHEEADNFARLQAAQADARAADAVAALTLSHVNLRRAHEVRLAFERADEESDAGERLLLELVAGESAVAMELQDVEGGLASLLGKTVIDPALTIAVAKALREVVSVGNAIRRRMENSLGAAENLKAQRRFLRAQRSRIGV